VNVEQIDYTEDNFKEVNFKELVNIEIYTDRDVEKDGTKMEGFNIIKNNDMMQYHYFGQEYEMVKFSPYLVIFNIIKNNIKHYIGFIALKPPSLNKTLRNMYFCPNLLPNLYKKDKFQLYVIIRMVILPSFRGMGLSKFLIDKMTEKIKCFIDYVEISSILLNTINFIPDSYNKTFLKLDKHTRDEFFLYLLKEQGGKAKGTKQGVKILANYAFKVLNKEKFKTLYLEMLKEFYNIKDVDLNLNDIDKYFNKTFDETSENNISLDDLLYFRKNQLPLILLHNNPIEEIKKLKYNYNKGEKTNDKQNIL